jgi:hypothetical protein
LWLVYYYYDHKYDLLPKASDGNLDYGLLKSMMAFDQFKREGDDYKKETGTSEDNQEGMVET